MERAGCPAIAPDNCVGSCTSTSDTVLLFSIQNPDVDSLESEQDPRFPAFQTALKAILHDLALQIVRDGEGASKLVEVVVKGAESDASAKKVALSIANSPLVKTAVAGEDANWGRVVMAVGKAGEPADRDRLAIYFGNVRVAMNGERDPDYDEDETTEIMRRDEIRITVDLNLDGDGDGDGGGGGGEARVWTCDLTKEYVAINGDYRS